MGGETRLEQSVNLMLDDLFYQRELNNSNVFSYDITKDCKISKDDMSIDERVKLLQLMNRRGIIEILQLKSYIYEINTSKTDFPTRTEDIEWPEVSLTGNAVMPSFSKLFKKFNITDQRDHSKKHYATIHYSEPLLTLEIDDFEPKTAIKVSYDSDVTRFLGKIFSQPAGKIFKNIEIIEHWTINENLDQFIKKRKLDCILPFIDRSLLPRAIKINSYTIYLNNEELISLLEQIRAKYKNNFEDIRSSL